MASYVRRHLAPAGGEASQTDVLQVQRVNQLRQIVRVMLHIIAIPRLARPAMATLIMRYRSETVVGRFQRQEFPVVSIRGPIVAQ